MYREIYRGYALSHLRVCEHNKIYWNIHWRLFDIWGRDKIHSEDTNFRL